MALEYFEFWFRETVSNLVRNRLMSLLAMSTVAIGLFILGGFYLALTNVRGMVRQQTDKLDITVILDPKITAKRRKEIYRACQISQVSKLTWISKGQALKEMHRDTPGIPLDDLLKDNPLGDELRVRVKDFNTIPAVQGYFNTMKGKGISETLSEVQFVNRLKQISRLLTVLGSVTLIVLGLGILAIIYNTIRLTVHARRREIRIMELVGATRGFIRVPFVLEGVLIGFSGSLLSVVMLAGFSGAVSRVVPEVLKNLIPVSQGQALGSCLAGMIFSGLLFGIVGSTLSLERSITKAAQRP